MVERSRVKQNNTRKRFYFYFAFLGVFFLVSEGLVGLAAEPFLAAALTGGFLGGLLALDGVFLAAVLVAALPSFLVALDGVFLAAAFFDGVTVFNFFLVANAPTDFLFALAFSLDLAVTDFLTMVFPFLVSVATFFLGLGFSDASLFTGFLSALGSSPSL